MIKSIEKSSVHRITSGQVLVDLQTAVKELVENSLDAGATTIDVKFKDYGLKSFEVNDNGSGIAPEDYDGVAMKHCTSKLSTFEDLTTVQTFGFRGEALSSLCALSDRVTITTATTKEAPMGTVLEFDNIGRVKSRSGKAARQRGTTVYVEGLFVPLPVRRKEFQRNSKREFGKALTLLSAYALVPCTKENKGVRLNVVHLLDKGRKSDQIRTDGKPSLKASISSLWGPKQVDSLAELNLDLEVIPEKAVLRRQANMDHDGSTTKIQVRGFISKFSPGHGRAGSDRQFFFINGRPCNPTKIQKAFNEVYRSFNTNQSPFIVADFILPTNSCDINVSPDKRTILLHSENALVAALKEALEVTFAPARSTFAVQSTQSKLGTPKSTRTINDSSEKSDNSASSSQNAPIDLSSTADAVEEHAVSDKSAGPPTTVRSPTPSLAIPASFLGGEEAQQTSSEEPSQDAPGNASHSSSSPSARPQPHPHPNPAGLIPVPQMQSHPRSPSPPTALRSVPPAVPVKPNAHPVQTVLNTTDAAWTMRPVSEQPARKKRRLDDVRNPNPRSALRWRLLSVTSVGSQHARADKSDEERDAESVEEEDNAEEEEEEKDVVEEDELAEEEMEEIRADADADLDESSITDGIPMHKSSTVSNGTEGDVGNSPLFLPEPDELQTSRQPAISTRVKVEEIELDVDMDNSSSSFKTDSIGDRRVDALTSEGNETSATARSSSSALSAPSVQSGTSISVEILRTADAGNEIVVPFSLQRVDLIWDVLSSKGPPASDPGPSSPQSRAARSVDPLAGVSNTSDEESAERELARVIDKEDFLSMEIIGQFNLGFIIARRLLRANNTVASGSDELGGERTGSPANAELDDLFIIDQHAADEKYNFETLQQTTKIDSQKLYKPRPLELTAADELLALENIDVLKSNGFEIIVDEDAEPSQGRIKLIAQPVSGSTDFDMKDLEELLHLMQDRSAGQKMVRCSKARAMFAMRACRKSVMIGMALSKSQMTSVVRHMGTMDQPWNCPHGRPTMRHLTNLNDTALEVYVPAGSSSRDISWSAL